MSRRKICVITGTRAEYGLLTPLLYEIENDKDLELQLVVTGMHLSPEFGLTYKEIAKEFKIDKKVEILLSSDTPSGISKSMGLAQILLVDVYEELSPDIIVVLGDRYEIFSAVASAMVCNIPIAHLDGGETTEGAMDEAIRHSISKMSHLHFACTETYRKRIIQLGENPSRVFNTGATSVDNMKNMNLLSREKFEEAIGVKLNKKNLSVTFHPVTLEDNSVEVQFKELLKALDELSETNIIFTKANSDTHGRVINSLIDEYVTNNSHKSIAFTSMGQLNYLSSMQHIDAVVGNSSSGIIEAPFFKIGTVNIGDRQKGRLRVESILDCKPNKHDILEAIYKVYSEKFQNTLKNVENPYGDGTASKKIKSILKSYDLENILKKKFYDIKV